MGGEEKLVINESDLRGVPRLKVRKPQQPEKSTLSSSAQQNKVPLKKPIVLSRPDGSKPLAAKPAQPLEEKVAEVTLPGIPVGSDAYTEGMKYVRDCLDYVTQSMELREKGNTTKADGRYKIAEEKSQKADALLRKAEFDKPKDYHPMNELGVLYFKMGKFTDAKEALDRAYAKEKGSTALLNNLGMVCLQLDDKAGAKKYFEKSYEINATPQLKKILERL